MSMNYIKKDLLMVMVVVSLFAAGMVALWWYDAQTGFLDTVARQVLGV